MFDVLSSCNICCNNNFFFKKCITCRQFLCRSCRNKLEKCPFCNSKFSQNLKIKKLDIFDSGFYNMFMIFCFILYFFGFLIWTNKNIFHKINDNYFLFFLHVNFIFSRLYYFLNNL